MSSYGNIIYKKEVYKYIYFQAQKKRSPVFRRSTMKVPTFSNRPIPFKPLIYLKKLDFIEKFNDLTRHFLLIFWYVV